MKKLSLFLKDSRKYLFLAIIISFITVCFFYERISNLNKQLNLTKKIEIGTKIELPNQFQDIFNKIIMTNRRLLLLFFDPNCGACVDEIPAIIDLNTNLTKKIKIVGISRAGEEQLKKFCKQIGINFPIISDPKGLLFNKCQIYRIPATMVIDNSVLKTLPSNINENPIIQLTEVENYIKNAN